MMSYYQDFGSLKDVNCSSCQSTYTKHYFSCCYLIKSWLCNIRLSILVKHIFIYPPTKGEEPAFEGRESVRYWVSHKGYRGKDRRNECGKYEFTELVSTSHARRRESVSWYLALGSGTTSDSAPLLRLSLYVFVFGIW